ncbi:MAG: type II toxin-antitoxin system VapC family toxin [Panacagrimonas sp.]
MIALDTNALARLLIEDDPAHCAAVDALVRDERVLILRTVLLETEWLLRSRYRFPREQILAFFQNLAGTENMVLEDEPETRRAIGWFAAGLDFADAMHLAAAGNTPLHTFDETFRKRTARLRDRPDAGVRQISVRLEKP